jgi:hypothetical protein
MSTFDFSDITPAGAYVNAIKAAQESDRRNAERHLETSESRHALKSVWTLVRRIAAAVAEKRPAISQLTSRPV